MGNPNTGKSSLFNSLTGMNQKVGNFAGVTVDKKTGKIKLNDGRPAEIIDLPGTYSLYPKSMDEQVVANVLLDPAHTDYPDLIIVVADATNLKRNLLLFTEVHDLNIPTILALNMMDQVDSKKVELNTETLAEKLNVDIVPISARANMGIDLLKAQITNATKKVPANPYQPSEDVQQLVQKVKDLTEEPNDYVALHLLHQSEDLPFLSELDKIELASIRSANEFDSNLRQVEETLKRYEQINDVLLDAYNKSAAPAQEEFSNRIDKILTHRILGLPLFFVVLFLIFQGIFTWAQAPMDLIDSSFSLLNVWLQSIMPEAWYTSLLTDGILAGIGGVVIFIPQIAILFAFIAILEETGYMARVTFMLDRVIRKFGLNGRSVVPLVSSVACAVPAIMSARTIDNYKDRIITIFVAPFISCSARIPVYTLLIAVVVPAKNLISIPLGDTLGELHLVNLQGLVMFSFYFLGLLAALLTALAMKFIMKSRQQSYFIMELPVYRAPRWRNVGITIWSKINTFVFEAGKIIVAISIVLWFLASFGQGPEYQNTKYDLQQKFDQGYISQTEMKHMLSSKKLEASYAGQFGKLIEPAIEPLGFDWRIGIALITSFAAREVFVGTMATIYSVGGDAEESTLKEKLKGEINPKTGKPFFTLPVALSLLIFYVFAMQCMSTLAVVKRETKSWKWPLLQLGYMTALAYASSWIVYNIFS